MERTQVDIINDNLIIGTTTEVEGTLTVTPEFRRVGNFVLNMNDVRRIVFFDAIHPLIHLIYQDGSTDSFEESEEYDQLKAFYDRVTPL